MTTPTPQVYEVLWLHEGVWYPQNGVSTTNPIIYVGDREDGHCLRFRDPEGKLWRVEGERELVEFDVLKFGDEQKHRDQHYWQPIWESGNGHVVTNDENAYSFRRPAHLVPVPDGEVGEEKGAGCLFTCPKCGRSGIARESDAVKDDMIVCGACGHSWLNPSLSNPQPEGGEPCATETSTAQSTDGTATAHPVQPAQAKTVSNAPEQSHPALGAKAGEGTKECPFCGNTKISLEVVDEILVEQGFDPNRWQLICSIHDGGCGSSCGFKDSPTEAVALWNKRIPPTQPAPADAGETPETDALLRDMSGFALDDVLSELSRLAHSLEKRLTQANRQVRIGVSSIVDAAGTVQKTKDQLSTALLRATTAEAQKNDNNRLYHSALEIYKFTVKERDASRNDLARLAEDYDKATAQTIRFQKEKDAALAEKDEAKTNLAQIEETLVRVGDACGWNAAMGPNTLWQHCANLLAERDATREELKAELEVRASLLRTVASTQSRLDAASAALEKARKTLRGSVQCGCQECEAGRPCETARSFTNTRMAIADALTPPQPTEGKE